MHRVFPGEKTKEKPMFSDKPLFEFGLNAAARNGVIKLAIVIVVLVLVVQCS